MKIDFGPDIDFMVFVLYLSDVLIGVGIVTGVTFTMHLLNVDSIYNIITTYINQKGIPSNKKVIDRAL